MNNIIFIENTYLDVIQHIEDEINNLGYSVFTLLVNFREIIGYHDRPVSSCENIPVDSDENAVVYICLSLLLQFTTKFIIIIKLYIWRSILSMKYHINFL